MTKTHDLTDLVDAHSGVNASFEEQTSLPVRHFHFHENPFLDSVNPQFFFRTYAHEDAYIKMKRSIEDHIAVGLTTAPSGTGKTLLTQILLSELDPRVFEPVLVLSYPSMTRTALLREIANEMGIEGLAPRASLHQVMSAIQNAIVELHKHGRRLIIIVDECHFLGVEPLQMVRTLSNMELPDRKLVTILLFGEDAFLTKMNKPEYASIFNRMFVRTQLRALTADETEQYVKFRCLVSGGQAKVFDDGVFAALYEKSRGIPREINRLCHSALFEAARDGSRSVGVHHLPAT